MAASPWPPPPQSAAAPSPPPRRRSSLIEREHDARARHADRVTERDRAAVHVHDVVGDAEVVHRREADRGERLVELEEVDVARPLRRACSSARLIAPRRLGGAATCRDRRPCRSRPARRAASSPSSSALAFDITMTAAPPSEICDALPAVMRAVPSNAGRRPPSDSVVVPGRTPSSVSTTIGSPLRWGIATGAISSAKRPSFAAAAARSWLFAASSSCASRVMPPTCAGVVLGARAHVHGVERAPQAVVDHRVDELAVAHAVARARVLAAGTARWSSTPCRRRPRLRRRRPGSSGRRGRSR